MNDQIRWAAADVDSAIAAIAECDLSIAHYQAIAEQVTEDEDAHATMLLWIEKHRSDKIYWLDRLPELRQRLADAGG